jgi:hypothetical protein
MKLIGEEITAEEKRLEAVEDRNNLSPWEKAHDTILWNTIEKRK